MQTVTSRLAWLVLLPLVLVACGGGGTKLNEIQRVKAGMFDVVVLSPNAALKQKDSVTIEFRSANGTLVDVGDVKGSASMSMSGTPMLGSIDVTRGNQPGRYTAQTQLDMAGTWRLTLEWKGPHGQGSTSFSSSVQ